MAQGMDQAICWVQGHKQRADWHWVNPRLAKRPLVFHGRLADSDLTSLGGTAAQHCHTKPSGQLHINDKLDLASFKKFI